MGLELGLGLGLGLGLRFSPRSGDRPARIGDAPPPPRAEPPPAAVAPAAVAAAVEVRGVAGFGLGPRARRPMPAVPRRLSPGERQGSG